MCPIKAFVFIDLPLGKINGQDRSQINGQCAPSRHLSLLIYHWVKLMDRTGLKLMDSGPMRVFFFIDLPLKTDRTQINEQCPMKAFFFIDLPLKTDTTHINEQHPIQRWFSLSLETLRT